jgi:hypothetical protein
LQAAGYFDVPPKHPTEMIMFKTLIATLILATASVALTSNVNAGPTQKYPTQAEQNWMERASQLGGGDVQ